MADHGRRTAMSALTSAAESPLHPSDGGHQPRRGRNWFGSWIGLRTCVRYGLSIVPTGFLALLLLAGVVPKAEAQTPAAATVNPDFVCQGETKDLAISGTAPYETVQYLVNSSGAGVRGTAWRVLNSDGTVNAAPAIINLGGLTGTYSTTLRIQNISADGSVVLAAHNASPITINFHPAAHASCAVAPATDDVTLSESSLTLTELDATNAAKTYTVVLETDPGASVVVTVASGDPTAVAVDTDSDMAGDQDTLTFTSSDWSQAQTVTLRALNDGDADAETVTITHTAAVSSDSGNAYHQIPIDNVTATTVDAGHGVTVSTASLSVAENSATADYTIALKSQPGGSVTVTPNSSATARATVSGALTFTTGNWSTPQTVTVTGAGAGTATISHMVTTTADTTAYPTSTTIASVTATVDNIVPTVANMIPDQAATAGTAFSYSFPANTFADATSLTYSATRPDNTALPAWLTFNANTRTFSGTPAAGDVGTVSVKVTADDGSATATDTFDIIISHPARNLDIQVADAYEGENITVTLTLSRAPGNVAAAQRTFRVGTQVPSAGNVTTCIADHGCAAGSTPVAASDFTATSTDVVFGPTETVKTASIPTATDSVSEGVEVVSIGIQYAPPGASDLGIFTSGSTQITGRNAFITAPLLFPSSIVANSYGQILGDSRPVPITITEAGGTTVSEDGSTTDSYTVVLDSEPSDSVTVTATAGAGVQVQGPGGTAGGMATLTFTTTNWSQAQTITVTGVDDHVDNAGDARTVKITHAASSTDPTYSIANAGEVAVTVTDDDTAGLAFVPVSVSLGEGATGSYTVALTSEPTGNVTVTITGQGGSTDLTLDTDSVMAGDQNTLTFTTADWSAPKTVMLTAVEDVDSANDMITLAHAPSGGGYGGDQDKDLTVTITDDDEADTAAPLVTSITRQSPTTSPTNEDSLTWRVTFNEAVVNVGAADFTLTGPDSSTTLTVTPVSGMETTTYDVAATAGNLASYDGTAVLGFASNHDIQDMAGNALAASPATPATNENTFVVDNTAPAITITGLTGTITGAVTATFTFDEAVTGFAVGDITVGNGDASAFLNTTPGTIWTALITPDVNGTDVTVDVGAGAATDRAGNGNTAATQASASYTAPGVTLSASSLTLTELGAASDAEKSYTVVLDTDPGANVTITVASNDTSAVAVDTDSDMAGDQSTLTFTTSDWSQPQTVTLRALNDGDTISETVTITHTAAVSPNTNPYHGIDISDVIVTTVDAVHGVVVSRNALTVAENGGVGTYTIVLKSQPSVDTGVVLTPIGDAATTSSSLFTFTTSNWRTAQTITVTGVNDDIDNAGDARTVTITHSTSTSDRTDDCTP